MNIRLNPLASFTLAALLLPAVTRAEVIADWNQTARLYFSQHAESEYIR